MHLGSFLTDFFMYQIRNKTSFVLITGSGKVDCVNNKLVTRWNDNKAVSIATNYITIFLTVSTKQYSQKEKKHYNINIP